MWTTDAGFAGKVLEFVRQQQLILPGSRVILALSGGADSMAMLSVFRSIASELHITLEAVHVDHGLRGEESRADARFVQQVCRECNLSLHLYDARSEGVVYPEHPSEDWARNLRYGYFEKLVCEKAEETMPVVIATAHTLSDQAETLLFRLARGAGVRGMGGIRPVRGIYVRPMLCVTRSEVEDYCRAKQIPYVTDSSNLADDYVRNRLRHHALPVLKTAVPGAEQNMGRFCARMQKLDGYFTAKAEMLLKSAECSGGWQAEILSGADWPILETALFILTEPVCTLNETTLSLLMQMLEKASGAVQLAPGKALRIRRGRLEWFSPGTAQPKPDSPIPLRPGVYRMAGGYEVLVQLQSMKKDVNFLDIHKKDLNYCADYAKIQGNVVLRTRLPGDRYRPRGRGLAKPLRKYYWELGVPPDCRSLLPVAAREQDVLWLWGQGFADGLAVGPDTQDVLMMKPL